MQKIGMFAAALVIAFVGGAGAASAGGDVAAGAKVFGSCRACHTLEPGKNRAGPTLHGLFGRRSGSIDGFNYSEPMKEADIVWDAASLKTYLANPRQAIPGNRMGFAGIRSEKDLEDLIAYLEEVTR